MVQIEGKYVHEKNENLDEYFKAVGVPFIPRKIMCSSSPTMVITKDDSEEWTITTSTTLRTTVIKFSLGKEYEEHMPGGVLKSKTLLEDNKFITNSIGPDNSKIERIYEFSDEGAVLHMKHDRSGLEAKRYFKRA